MLVVWLAVIVGGGAATGPVLSRATSAKPVQGMEADEARSVLSNESDHGLQLIALVDKIDPHAPATAAAIGRATAEVSAMPGVRSAATLRTAPDGTGVAIEVTLVKMTNRDTASKTLDGVETRMRALATQVPGSTVQFGGADVLAKETNNASQADLSRAELISLPITLIVLIFIFGGLAPASLPVFGAITTMCGAFGALLGFTAFVDLDNTVVSVIALLGLGLSIDYGLLLVARYREELAAGHDRPEAVKRAWGTAGRTVMFSGLTIVFALSGLLLFNMPRLQAMGAAGISAAILAMLVALSFTATLLGVLGRTVKPRKRQLARAAARRQNQEAGFFARLARVVQRSPLLIALAATAALVVVALPVLHLSVKLPARAGLPDSVAAARVNDELLSRYGISADPAVQIVAQTDAQHLSEYAQRWAADPSVSRVETVRQEAPNLSSVVLEVRGGQQDAAVLGLVGRLRADRPAGVRSWVTGEAASLVDLRASTEARLPYAIAVMVLSMLILLFLMTGSLLVPLKAIVMNLLSLGATFGILTLVFQDGWAAGPLHTLTVGGLSPYLLVTVFAFAFGFSMDYEVFLLGRIKEYVDAGRPTDVAVRLGLQSSGRIVSSAALLMLIVFGCFAGAQLGDLEELGVGLFVAILIDATLVRCVLVPATMMMLGRWNWWAPGPLLRLYGRFGVTEQEQPDRHRDLVRTV